MMNSMRYFSFMMLALVCVMGSSVASAATSEDGKAAFVKHGCWQCHGFVGQGGPAGPKLAPEPKPYEFVSVFVRHTKGRMPPYSEKILSNDDLASIYTYLRSIPKTPDYKTIPLLK